MSYDLDCYLTPGARPLPSAPEGLTWQIAIYPPTPIDAEDMPEALLQAVGPRTHLMNLHLEGQVTSQAEAALQELISTLCLEHDALIHDLQSDMLTSRLGHETLRRTPPKPKPKPLKMSFLFNCRPGLRNEMRARFLDTIAEFAPKAMPRRFGSYEPMPFTFEHDGRDCLLEDWALNESFYFWRGTAPYQHAFASMPDPFTRHSSFVGKYTACSIVLELSPRVLKTKKDKADMVALFAALSVALDVFYAEISETTLYGHWRGVPEHAPLARCIGTSYASIWSEFCDGAQAHSESHWVRDTIIAGHDMLAPRKEMRAPDNPRQEGRDVPALYAEHFPLDIPDPTPWQFEPWGKELALRVATLRRSREFYEGSVFLVGRGFFSGKTYIAGGWDHHGFRLEKAKPPIAPQHVSFKAQSERAVDAFYEAALSLGAAALHPPQLRPEKGDWYYACEVADPDGHRVEMLFRG